MKYSYHKQSNVKIVVYAVALALVLGICLVVIQDIKAPVDHVSQEISVTLEK